MANHHKHHKNSGHMYLIVGALVVVAAAVYLWVAHSKSMWPFDIKLNAYEQSRREDETVTGGSAPPRKGAGHVGGGALKQQTSKVTHDRGQAPRSDLIDLHAAVETSPERDERFQKQMRFSRGVGIPETDKFVTTNKRKDVLTAHFLGGNETLSYILANHKGGCIGPTSLAEDHSGDEKSYQLSAYN